ncbi:UNVERIFIED_CONTAM: hypothetical protein NCL1_03214 [Trichonephila clavipes]
MINICSPIFDKRVTTHVNIAQDTKVTEIPILDIHYSADPFHVNWDQFQRKADRGIAQNIRHVSTVRVDDNYQDYPQKYSPGLLGGYQFEY